jgi:hypothetical protein
MASMADITVKKNDGTTDIVWTAKSASAGDGNAAVWYSDSVGATLTERPDMRVSSSGAANVRRVKGVIRYPVRVTDTASGITKVTGFCQRQYTDIIPDTADQATVDEFASQAGNLQASTLLKLVSKQRFAPT